MKLSTHNEFVTRCVLILCLGLLVTSPSLAKPRHPDVRSLSPNAREIFNIAMQWGDSAFDPHANLCLAPETLRSDGFPVDVEPQASEPMVRNSVWYAMGLLLRDQRGDRDRAAQIIRVILKQQYREPDKPWDGTFRDPPSAPQPEYDPNWREFIGTAFAEILIEYPNRIPADLATQMMDSIVYAVNGEIKEKRLKPTYTNIALMYGFLWNYAAVNGNRPDWVAPSTAWQEEVYRLFKEHDAFWEFNSPTYAGTDIFALAQWRDYGSTPRIRTMGAEMEATLWRTLADLYNTNLGNISGPYDRSYGMDMQSYVSEVGLELRTVLDAAHAPLVGLDHPPVDHVADLWHIPAIVILDIRIPSDAMAKFRAFSGEHQVRHVIDDQRTATAWIGKTLIYGGEITNHTRGVDAHSQFHPVTLQWQAPRNIGWIQLTECPPIDATADEKGIAISASGDVRFRIFAPGITPASAKAGTWILPGLTVTIDADAKSFSAEQRDAFVDLTYTGITKMMLSFNTEGK